MDMKEALDIMRTEKKCVLRQGTRGCNKKCETCDLVRPTEDVLFAYTLIISCVEELIKELKDDTKRSSTEVI